MVYRQLFQKSAKKEVQVAIIGTGYFGTSIISQQNYVPRLRIVLAADKNPEAAKESFLKADIPEKRICYASDPQEAQRLIDAGKYVYTDNPMVIMEIPSIDVVGEATGSSEAGALHCKVAIEHGKHVAAISKEMDSVIGPFLRLLATEHGVTCSPVAGDQPSLLMCLVEWARTIGLHVISAGKSRDAEFILDEKRQTVFVAADGITVHEDTMASIPDNKMKYFQMIPNAPQAAEEYLHERSLVLREMPKAGGYDLCELTIMANSLGFAPSVPETTNAALRIAELPIAYCESRNNGRYSNEGIIDLQTTLRRQDECGMDGGVYMVVTCDNEYSRHILTTKGPVSNYDNSATAICRPFHLCGLEVGTTLLCQGLLGLHTGAQEYTPRLCF